MIFRYYFKEENRIMETIQFYCHIIYFYQIYFVIKTKYNTSRFSAQLNNLKNILKVPKHLSFPGYSTKHIKF